MTDVLGGQVTLVGCSPSPSPSPDSLEDILPHYSPLPSFIISEPCDPLRPSITRGIGRPLSGTPVPTEVEVTLSDESSRLNSEAILGRVKQIIDARAPPKGFIFSRQEIDGSGLSLEYPGGVQIELRVCESEEKEAKGIKMRRISGDQLQYSQLCQQLISCITVWRQTVAVIVVIIVVVVCRVAATVVAALEIEQLLLSYRWNGFALGEVVGSIEFLVNCWTGVAGCNSETLGKCKLPNKI